MKALSAQAVGYIRCSTDQQEDSPEQQKRAILEYADRHGHTVSGWYIDFGKSGTTFDQRPEFRRLLAAVENRPAFSLVIAYDESRWGRAIDSEENTYWRVHFRRHGVDVVLVKTSIDPNHEYAPMLKSFEGIQASQYSKKLSELTLRGAMSNGRFSSGGTAPFAYRRKAINQKTGATRFLADGEWCVAGQEKVVWDIGEPSEVDTVRDIFDMRVKGFSYIAIASSLNQRGVPCPKRGRWKNLDQKWSTGTIKSIINNPVYHGARVYNRNSMSKIRASREGRNTKSDRRYPLWLNEQSEWVVEKDAHPPVVSRETWDLAQRMRPSLPTQRKPRSKVPYLLSGLIRCARCGFHFQGQSTRAKAKKYHRYICSGYNAKRVCQYTAVGREEVEDFVVESIRQSFSGEAFEKRVAEHLEQLAGDDSGENRLRLERVRKHLEEVDHQIYNITRAIERGGECFPSEPSGQK
jgi:site-specific DNA recombinase